MADRLDEPREAAQATISQADFERILNGMELLALAMVGCQANLIDRKTLVERFAELKANFTIEASYAPLDSTDTPIIGVVQQFGLTMQVDEKPVLILNCAFQVDYKSQEEFTPEFFDTFRNSTLVLQTIPYGRELLQSLTTRMNIPTITLPIFRVGPLAFSPSESPSGVE